MKIRFYNAKRYVDLVLVVFLMAKNGVLYRGNLYAS